MLGLYQPPESYWYMDNMTLSASKTLTPHPSAVSRRLACRVRGFSACAQSHRCLLMPWLTQCTRVVAVVAPSNAVPQFAQFFKTNVAAGRPVIGGFRVKGGTYPDYDHIM
jgi:hypothetical protein